MNIGEALAAADGSPVQVTAPLKRAFPAKRFGKGLSQSLLLEDDSGTILVDLAGNPTEITASLAGNVYDVTGIRMTYQGSDGADKAKIRVEIGKGGQFKDGPVATPQRPPAQQTARPAPAAKPPATNGNRGDPRERAIVRQNCLGHATRLFVANFVPVKAGKPKTGLDVTVDLTESAKQITQVAEIFEEWVFRPHVVPEVTEAESIRALRKLLASPQLSEPERDWLRPDLADEAKAAAAVELITKRLKARTSADQMGKLLTINSSYGALRPEAKSTVVVSLRLDDDDLDRWAQTLAAIVGGEA